MTNAISRADALAIASKLLRVAAIDRSTADHARRADLLLDPSYAQACQEIATESERAYAVFCAAHEIERSQIREHLGEEQSL